jgi:hypothetical protein
MNSEEKDAEARFSAYVDALVSVIGHADREKPRATFAEKS